MTELSEIPGEVQRCSEGRWLLPSLAGSSVCSPVSALAFICLIGLAAATDVHAHGTHSWFESPERGARISSEVRLAVSTSKPAKNKYVHMQIIRVSDEVVVWEDLVGKDGNSFATTVGVRDWQEGTYRVDAVLLGEVFPHPRARTFEVQRGLSASE